MTRTVLGQSSGARRRPAVHAAATVLLMDEPTNHLDIESIIWLELGGETGTEAQPHAYPSSYIEYVERTGHEAPGVHR